MLSYQFYVLTRNVCMVYLACLGLRHKYTLGFFLCFFINVSKKGVLPERKARLGGSFMGMQLKDKLEQLFNSFD